MNFGVTELMAPPRSCMAQRSASGEAAAFKGAEKSDDARTLGEPVSESIEVDLRLCPLDDARF